jgi:hypothetical protein
MIINEHYSAEHNLCWVCSLSARHFQIPFSDVAEKHVLTPQKHRCQCKTDSDIHWFKDAQHMSKEECTKEFKRAITELLRANGATDYRWVTEDERSDDEVFDFSLIVGTNAYHYCWCGNGIDELVDLSRHHGYAVGTHDFNDIGFLKLTDRRRKK